MIAAASFDTLNDALYELKNDKIIVVPTDTVHGLVCPAKPDILGNLYKIKKRDPDKPFSLLFSDLLMVEECFVLPLEQQSLLKKYLPGPFTFLIKNNNKFKWVTDTDKIGIRIPDYTFLTRLISSLGMPLLSTSANISGEGDITDTEKLIEVFEQKVPLILFDKKIKHSPSTIVDLTYSPFKIIRQGAGKFEG